MGGEALDQEALRIAYAEERWDEIDRLVSNDVTAAHAACGTVDHVRQRLVDYQAAGLDQVIVSGIADPAEIAAVLNAINAKS